MNFLPAVMWLAFCQWMMSAYPKRAEHFLIGTIYGTFFLLVLAFYQTERENK